MSDWISKEESKDEWIRERKRERKHEKKKDKVFMCLTTLRALE